jgi:hypothetical protein
LSSRRRESGDRTAWPQRTEDCWIAGRHHACLGGSIQSHKNKDSLYGRKSLESGRIGQIVYKYRASPTVRSIIPMHHSKRSIPQVDKDYQRFGYETHPTHALPGSDGTRASLAAHQRLQEPLRAWDRAPLVYVQNFHPKGIRRGTAAGSPRGPYQRKISNLHLRTSLPTGLYALLRPKGGAVARRGRSPSGIEYYATVELRSL